MFSNENPGRRGPVTRRRAAKEQRDNEEAKRRRKMFEPPKVIGPNDIIVATRKGKIKIECQEEEGVDVKVLPAPEPIQEELSSGHSVLEAHETTPTPAVKVECDSDEDGSTSNTQDGVRNVLLEEIDIPMDCSDGEDNAGMNELRYDEVRQQCEFGCQEEIKMLINVLQEQNQKTEMLENVLQDQNQKIEMLENVLQDQNQKIEMLMTRKTENEKELAELRGRLRKYEENTVWNLPMTSKVDDCNVPDPSNSTSCASNDKDGTSAQISQDNDKTKRLDNQSDQEGAASFSPSETSDDGVVTLFPEVEIKHESSKDNESRFDRDRSSRHNRSKDSDKDRHRDRDRDRDNEKRKECNPEPETDCGASVETVQAKRLPYTVTRVAGTPYVRPKKWKSGTLCPVPDCKYTGKDDERPFYIHLYREHKIGEVDEYRCIVSPENCEFRGLWWSNLIKHLRNDHSILVKKSKGKVYVRRWWKVTH